MVKIGITVFPGSNCDRDVYNIFKTKLESDIRYIKDKDKIETFDAIIIPGGFTYGDRLRAGAIAAHSSLMNKIKKQALILVYLFWVYVMVFKFWLKLDCYQEL